VHGDRDIHAVTSVAQEYFAEIQAPAKEFVLLDGLGHMALFTRPDLVLAELVSRVLPQSCGRPGR